jgi:hypothetical protein
MSGSRRTRCGSTRSTTVGLLDLQSNVQILSRYSQNLKERRAVYILVGSLTVLVLFYGIMSMLDIFSVYDYIFGVVNAIQNFNVIGVKNIACINSLQQMVTNSSQTFNNLGADTFAFNCPQLMADLIKQQITVP